MSSTIEQKKNEKLNESADGTPMTSNWVAFGINVLQNFILTLFIGLLGANFIFLSSSSTDFLETLLPTKNTSYFPTIEKTGGTGAGSRITRGGGGAGGENYHGTCNSTDKNSFNIGNLKFLGIGGAGGWPYKYKKDGYVGIIQDYMNWIIYTIYGTFSFNREILQTWIGYFSKENDKILSNDTFQILFVAPITLMASLLVFPAGFFVSLFKSFTTETFFGLIWAIAGLFLGYSWVLSSCISIVQFIQYLIFFMIIPLLTNLTMVKKILHCNIITLGLLFGALVCGSAITSLDYVTSSVMIVVYLIMAIKALW